MDKYVDTFDFFRQFNKNKKVDIDWIKTQIYGEIVEIIPENFPLELPSFDSIISRWKLNING